MTLLSVSGARQLQQLAADLKDAGAKGLRKDLRRDIAAAVKPMRRAVQEHARSIPTHGSRHTGLRADIARATQIKALVSSQAAVKLQVTPSRMPDGKRRLPALMDGRGRWRHPVFGNREVWVNQPSHTYFWPAVKPHIQDVRQAVVEAVDKAIRRLG